jgi:uncharacterized protein YjbI with pentapeptide repeats
MGCLFYNKAHMEGVNLCETTVSGVGKLFEECHLEGALLRDLSLIGCTLDGAYLSGGVVEGLRTTHPQIFRGAHVEEKELGDTGRPHHHPARLRVLR